MPIGKSVLQRCPDPSLRQARLRFISCPLHDQPRSVSHYIHSELPSIPSLLSRALVYNFAIEHTHHPLFVRTARLSTFAASLAQSKQHERKFLKPRGKPTFRTHQVEDDEVLNELKKAEAHYRDQYGQDARREEDQPHRSRAWSAGQHTDFKSAFFPSPDIEALDTKQDTKVQSFYNASSGRIHSLPKSIRVLRKDASTSELEQELHYVAHNDPHPAAIHGILEILIRERGIKPTYQHYEALILANTWPEYGSVSNLERILTEMEAEDLEFSANIISAVLKVLAVHPSIELSRQMLIMAERKWTQLSSQTHHHLVAAMIRTGQTELAAWSLDALRSKDKMHRSRDREIIPDYLIVLLITEMVKIGDWEGILRYMYKLRNRRAADRDIPIKFWGWLLEQAAKAARTLTEHSSSPLPTPAFSPTYISIQHSLSNPSVHLAKYTYHLYVHPMSLRPSYTTLLNILHVAANTGDPKLAHSVVATMTYMDGIDSETGEPIAKLSHEIADLVEVAKIQAKENETDEDRRKREEEENARREREKLEEEDEKWWKEVIDYYDVPDSNTPTQPSSSAQDIPNINKSKTTAKPLNPTSTTDTPVPVPNHPSTNPQNKTSKLEERSERKEAFPFFDPKTVPPGNMWPLFPKFINPGTQTSYSAHVDPWDALGPRMSSRRKWTEAQRYFKTVENMTRGMERRAAMQKWIGGREGEDRKGRKSR